jgi:K+-sensing histidine kinase KdpD
MAKAPKILIVDDDERNVRLMESILTANKYDVVKAYDGEQALKRVSDELPDLLLLDAMMPKVNGYEVCLRLKKHPETQLVPIIMVTALNALEDKVQALEIGADDFLAKPINRLELLAKMRSVLRAKSLHDEIVRTKAELEAKNQELLELEHLKESLMQMIVHDLKNPLTGIMGNIELLMRKSGNTDESKRSNLLLKCRDSSNRLLKMIMDLLDISKLEEDKMELQWSRFDMTGVVKEALKELRGVCEVEKKTLVFEHENDSFDVTADRELLQRVIGNLLNNAIKYSPESTEIRIEIGHGERETTVTVADQGHGIPPEYHERIFEKFAQVDVKKSGHKADRGLGLTFCKMAVEAHGGRIWVESAESAGSRFSFTLPDRTSVPAKGTKKQPQPEAVIQ